MSAPQAMERSDRVEENNNNKNDMFKGQVEEDGDDAKAEEEASVIVTEAEEWLCVAKLPLDTTQEEKTGGRNRARSEADNQVSHPKSRRYQPIPSMHEILVDFQRLCLSLA